MKFMRRAAVLLRERASLAVGGSVLWWIMERLLDKGIDQMMALLKGALLRL